MTVADRERLVTNFNHQIAALRWGGVAALALIAEHLLCWDSSAIGAPSSLTPNALALTREQSYSVGTTTLLAAFAGWVVERREANALDALGALTTIVGMGGITVIFAYWLRRRTAQRDGGQRAAGRTGARWQREEDLADGSEPRRAG